MISGATFSGDPLTSDIVNGISYSILGDTDLQAPWDLEVVELLPALGDYDGVVGADWAYRSFRLTTPFDSLPSAFLKAGVTTAP